MLENYYNLLADFPSPCTNSESEVKRHSNAGQHAAWRPTETVVWAGELGLKLGSSHSTTPLLHLLPRICSQRQ